MGCTSGTGEVWVCSLCGERAAALSSEPVPVTVRGRSYVVDGLEYEHCTACGESLFDAGQLAVLDERAADMARAELGRMNPEEISALRHELGVTQAGLERLLGASPGSVGRWERDEIVQGGTADRLMRVLQAHPELVSELAEPALIVREGRGPYKKRTR